MPSISATSEITAVSDKTVGMRFVTAFIILYFNVSWYDS